MVDPRTIDGTPYEVAQLATAQAEALVSEALWATEAARLMARSAEMTRQLMDERPSDPVSWEKGPHGRLFEDAKAQLHALKGRLRIAARAAGFDPRAPLGR